MFKSLLIALKVVQRLHHQCRFYPKPRLITHFSLWNLKYVALHSQLLVATSVVCKHDEFQLVYSHDALPTITRWNWSSAFTPIYNSLEGTVPIGILLTQCEQLVEAMAFMWRNGGMVVMGMYLTLLGPHDYYVNQ
jgi:hypothetical protein